MAAISHSAASSTAPLWSPDLGSVPLSSAITHLLCFILASRTAAPDDPAFPLSPSYCISILNDKDLFAKLVVGDSRMSPDLLRGTGKSIGGDLNVDDEGSEQRQFKPVQSLHHGSIGYQPMHTQIGLAKKAMSLEVNQEHKQE
jgi:hypothetical protein